MARAVRVNFWRGERTAVIRYLGEKYLVTAPLSEPGEGLLLVARLALLGAVARCSAG